VSRWAGARGIWNKGEHYISERNRTRSPSSNTLPKHGDFRGTIIKFEIKKNYWLTLLVKVICGVETCIYFLDFILRSYFNESTENIVF